MGSFSYSSFSTGIQPLLFSLIILLTQSACPDNPKEIVCGENQVDVNGTCECADGYHWNEDQTQCLLDTTSHNFVWEIDTLGIGGSYLKDVAVIDENNVWVVGQIETDSGYFGAAIWNGEEWTLKKLHGPGINTPSIKPRGIWALSENDIWFASGSIYHWDGVETSLMWQRNIGTNETVEQVWGTSSSDLYFVGGNGNIVHYDGSDFRRMESGTETGIINIWGLDGQHIWAVTYQNNANGIINEVLFYNGNEWTTKFNKSEDNWPPVDYTKPSGTFRSVWVYGDTVYISCASLYKESIKTGEGILVPLEEMHWQLGWGTGNVRGRNYNDIVVTTHLAVKSVILMEKTGSFMKNLMHLIFTTVLHPMV